MFRVKKKIPAISIEMLDEPSFFFEPSGLFLMCNEMGGDFLHDMGYTEKIYPQQLDDFNAIFKSTFNMNEKKQFFHENWHYRLCQSTMDGGTLVRLSMVKRNESITRLSMSLNIMPWGVMTVNLDDDKKIVYCNPKAGEFLDVSYENLIGFSIQDVLNVFGVTEDLTSYVHGESPSFYDHSMTVDDKIICTRFYFNPFLGDFRYCMIVMQDITDEKVKEGQFFQAQRLESLGQLAGGVAHDFNNILSIIDGYARMSKKNMEKDEVTANYLEHISKAVERGAGLTSRLLTFGRHKILKDKVTNLGQLLKDQIPLISPLMDASIFLTVDVEDDVFVEVAPDNICQILFNLCINARDAMKDGGNLIVEVRKTENDTAIIQIIDTGTGMSDEVRAKMFDPFFTTKDQGKGTGLGLSMVYGLVKDMHGEIEVNSKLGSGTSFQIKLPLSSKLIKSFENVDLKKEKSEISGLTVVVAEDEPELLNILSSMLEDVGIKVIRAHDGNEALALQEEYDGDIDFLITDVVMPELNGVKLAELFCACRPDVKVLFMSGYPASGQMARVPIPDGALLMPKPVRFENLKTILEGMSGTDNDNIKDEWKHLTGEWLVAS